MVFDASTEFLANDWASADTRKSCNDFDLIEIREIRENSYVEDAQIRWGVGIRHFGRCSSGPASSS
jgi:hypothetical protein